MVTKDSNSVRGFVSPWLSSGNTRTAHWPPASRSAAAYRSPPRSAAHAVAGLRVI
jgi:hypothetical protein